MHMMTMRRMSPGEVLTGRWESKDRKLRSGLRTANQDHLMVMHDEMAMAMKMKIRVLMRMLMIPMVIPTPKIKREINERERQETIEEREKT